MSDRDPVFAARAGVWAGNLERIAWSHLRWTVGSAQAPLPTRREAELGPGAWVQQIRVRWSLAGERRTAEEEVWLTFVAESPSDRNAAPVRLAGDGDGPTASARSPIWLQQPVHLHRAGSVLVLTDAPQADRWLREAAAARRAVQTRLGIPASAGSDRDPLVLEVPQSRVVLERILGVTPGSYATVAAAAWPMGSDTRTAPVHVLVNPEATRRLSRLGRDVLLTHEVVHVALRSPGSPAPSWLVEGYADQISYAAYPAGAAPAEQSVRTAVRADGIPEDWPSESAFAPDAVDLELGYDLAWTACRTIERAYGAAALRRFYAAADSGASVPAAAASIGTSERALLQRWRADLTALADG